MTSEPSLEELDDEPWDGSQPWSLRVAVLLMRSAAGLSLLVMVIGFLRSAAIKRNLADLLHRQHNYSQHNVDILYQNLVASTVIVTVLSAAVWLWMAQTNGAGKKWARTIATGLGAVNVAQFVLSLGEDGLITLQLVLNGLNVLLAIVILVLLWRWESSDYYWAKSRRPAISSD